MCYLGLGVRHLGSGGSSSSSSDSSTSIPQYHAKIYIERGASMIAGVGDYDFAEGLLRCPASRDVSGCNLLVFIGFHTTQKR